MILKKKFFVLLVFFIVFNGYAQQSLDEQSNKRLEAWHQLIKEYKNTNTKIKLKTVNDFFNRLTYISETSLQGSPDTWQTPYEFLVAGSGDCEDYAIAKYFTLVAMGIPEKQLRIAYVVIRQGNQAHMVLTYYAQPDAEPLILDNIKKSILSASQRSDLIPVYSFNGSSVWLVDQLGKPRPYARAMSLKKWQALIQRLELQEKIK